MKFLITVLVLQMSLDSVESCWPCRKFTYNSYIDRIKYLARLPNSLRITELSLIGTHSSLSYTLPEDKRTQDLTLKQQLTYGVRVFDLEVSPKDDFFIEFVIYSDSTPIDLEFDQILEEFDKFLDDNPWEFVILFLRSADMDVDLKRNCDILSRYYDFRRAGKRLVENWELDDTLEMHRGKILLASLDGTFGTCSLDLKQCRIQSDSKVDNAGNLKRKWWNIYLAMWQSYYVSSRCVINDISFKDLKQSRRTVAQVAGYYFDGSCRRPLNEVMTQEFIKPKKKLVLVFGDFLTQELIDKVNDANFPNASWRIGWD